jgi:hypothetical protein
MRMQICKQIYRAALRHGRWSMLAAALVLAGGCQTSGDSIIQPENHVDEIPWFLPLNYNAITMLTTDAIQLQATPMTVDSVPITGEIPPVIWTTSDTALKVDATGRVTSSGPVRAGLVFATMSNPTEGWTLIDTAIVTTVDTVYHFAGYQLLPQGGVGDTVIPMAVANNFNAVLLDASGQPLRDAGGALISPTASYTTDAPFQSLQVYLSPYPRATAYNVGTFTVRASSYLFGTVYRDSVTYRITYPRAVTLYIQRMVPGTGDSPSAMSQTDITIIQGGTVNFRNQNTTLPADIVFDDLSSVVGGNIPVVSTGGGSIVTFPNVGEFTYHSSLGFTGTITVVPF